MGLKGSFIRYRRWRQRAREDFATAGQVAEARRALLGRNQSHQSGRG